MLVLKRRIGEVLHIGETVSVRVLETRRGEVRLGFVAPSEVRIFREEIFRAIESHNRGARLATPEALAEPGMLVEGRGDTAVTSNGVGSATHGQGAAPSATMVEIRSRRFGTFAVPRERLLEFPHGLIGFPADHRYVVLDRRPRSPFKWLISVDDPELAFLIADPDQLVSDYQGPRALAARHLGAAPADIALFVIVTVGPDAGRVSANLLAPVAVELATRTARQLVLEDARLPLAHPLRVPASAGAAPAEHPQPA